MVLRATCIVAGLLFLLGALIGCGGSDDGGSSTITPGIYNASYNRAQGTMVIGVDASGIVDIALNDDTAGFFHGNGQVTHLNTFSVLCARSDGQSITINGTFAGSGAGATAAGNVAGAFAVNYTATFRSAPNRSAFTGHYEGFFNGTDAGIWMGDIDANGHFTGVWNSDTSADVTLDGTVSANGFVDVHGAAGQGVTINAVGAMQLNQQNGVLGFGEWSNTMGGKGRWEGGLANE